jgi:acyl carrier protein
MNPIQTLVDELLVQISKTRKTLSPNKLLVEDLGFDSLKMMELMSTIEDRLDIAIPLAEATRIRTVADLYSAVAKVVSEADKTSLIS